MPTSRGKPLMGPEPKVRVPVHVPARQSGALATPAHRSRRRGQRSSQISSRRLPANWLSSISVMFFTAGFQQVPART